MGESRVNSLAPTDCIHRWQLKYKLVGQFLQEHSERVQDYWQPGGGDDRTAAAAAEPLAASSLEQVYSQVAGR